MTIRAPSSTPAGFDWTGYIFEFVCNGAVVHTEPAADVVSFNYAPGPGDYTCHAQTRAPDESLSSVYVTQSFTLESEAPRVEIE